MNTTKQIRLENLPLFLKCCKWNRIAGDHIEVRPIFEIDGEHYVTVRYEEGLLDEDDYQDRRATGV